ncbi:MAG TPA: gamma-glutamyltransferase family protein [Hypericibacter adhaerens]|uniref:gamma-glutamyltransferase family protein n=1 Tax=Hypericibacter adhaerens TaxID=2602016 RepID=UPI002C49420A|nr:gamma-glutamyltransferase family protein [Hypericibacter adhaerens]HWA44041.1 gamma-glutamyltransferase family protein [Hypericibacter adhaerens]
MITSRPEIVGTFGVVATTHWLATNAAMSILEKGGNAFDAAAAAGFVHHIVEPDQNGPGGDVPIILWSARHRKLEVICGQGVAPAAATVARMKALGLDVLPGTGHLPAVVPGSFGAWMVLLREHGQLPLREIMTPAITVARDGFLVKPEVAALLRQTGSFIKEYWPSTAAVFLPNGEAPASGSLLRVPAQAESYERILREAEAAGGDRVRQIEAARHAWYQGFVAEAVDRFFRQKVMDTSGEAHAGFLTGQDMAQWSPPIEAPVTLDYDRYTVCKPGPWAQSPVLLQQLALLKGFDIAGMDHCGPDFVHLVQECTKLALADREAFYGDPAFVDVPLDRLLSEGYNAERRKLIGAQASLEMRPGHIEGKGGRIFLRARGSTRSAHAETTVGAEEDGSGVLTWAEFLARTRGDTCHLDIIDRWGNMISATPSGGWMTGSPVVPGLGFCVSARGQMFWLDESHPNGLAPGKRPRTTLTPGLALRDGEPYMAFGTPGGDQQDQWSLHAFLRHVHHGLNLQEAIDAPGFYTEHMPSSFYPREWDPGHLAVESEFPKATLAELDRRGHRLQIYPRWGHYNSMTMATRADGMLRAAASPRRMQCYAIGR